MVFHGTSLAVLTYIGFDAISTLSEEVRNPKRNILPATVLVCLITGVLASAEVYGAQLLRPDWHFPESEVETAFIHVAAIAAGIFLSKAINLTLIIATIGSGMGAQLGAARLLCGMSYEPGAELLNFGAIIAFMGVNLASLAHYYIRGYDRTLTNLWPPIAGFLICAAIWWNLSPKAKSRRLYPGCSPAWLTAPGPPPGFQADLVNFYVPNE